MIYYHLVLLLLSALLYHLTKCSVIIPACCALLLRAPGSVFQCTVMNLHIFFFIIFAYHYNSLHVFKHQDTAVNEEILYWSREILAGETWDVKHLKRSFVHIYRQRIESSGSIR